MARYRCEHCLEVFFGENALEAVKNHIFSCAVTQESEEHFERFKKEIQEKYPQVEDIELREGQWDAVFEKPDALIIRRKDGSTCRLELKETLDNEEAFQKVRKRLEEEEAFIAEILVGICAFAPDARPRFLEMNEYGGYEFEIAADGEKKTFVIDKSRDTVKKFYATIRANCFDRIEGVVEKEGGYFIGGALVSEWLRRNEGRRVRIEKMESITPH